MNYTGQQKQLFSFAKAVLAIFAYFWSTDCKFVLIFVVEGKVSELRIYVTNLLSYEFTIYPYNE